MIALNKIDKDLLESWKKQVDLELNSSTRGYARGSFASELRQCIDEIETLQARIDAMKAKVEEARTSMLTLHAGQCAIDACQRPSEPFRYWLDAIRDASEEHK